MVKRKTVGQVLKELLIFLINVSVVVFFAIAMIAFTGSHQYYIHELSFIFIILYIIGIIGVLVKVMSIDWSCMGGSHKNPSAKVK